MIRLIAAERAAKGLLFLGLGLAIVHLLHHDSEEVLSQWLSFVHIDPHGRLPQKLITSVTGLEPGDLRLGGIGAFAYCAVYAIEAFGLWRNRAWAEWFTTISAALLVPVEIYKIFAHFSALKIVILVLNLAIIAYLAWRLRGRYRAAKATAADAGSAQPAA